MAQIASDQSRCKDFKTLVLQDISKQWSWFRICDYKFLDPTNQFRHFAFVSSVKHWFPNDSSYVNNGDYDDHNDDSSDNNGNYVDYNDENDVSFMVIIILC